MNDSHEKLADFQAEYIDRYIALADTKAAFSFGITAAVAGYLVSRDSVQSVLKGDIANINFWLTSAILITLVLAGVSALAAIVPRTWLTPKDGLVSWTALSKFATADAYLNALKEAREDTILEARFVHAFDLAQVCAAKHRWVARALLLTSFSLFMTGWLLLRS